jgi:hypothetical protein
MCLNGRHLYIYKSFLELNVKTCCFLQFSIQVLFLFRITLALSPIVKSDKVLVGDKRKENQYTIKVKVHCHLRNGYFVTGQPVLYLFRWLKPIRETAYRSYVTDFLSGFGGVCVAHLFQFFELIVFVLCLVLNVACVFGSHHLLISLFIGGKNDRWDRPTNVVSTCILSIPDMFIRKQTRRTNMALMPASFVRHFRPPTKMVATAELNLT